MKNPVCEELAIFQSKDSEHENLRLWYIVNSVLNAFLAISAITLNSVTVQALRKTSSLPKPLKALLLNLAISDLGIGLLVEPFYFGLLVNWLQGGSSTAATCATFLSTLYLLSAASCLGVMALSVDRFLAVHLHLRYEELACDSQTSFCCYDLNMDVQYISFVILLMGLQEYLLPADFRYWSSLPRFVTDALFQDLFCRAAPQKSNSRPSGTSSTGWPKSKCR